MSCVVAVRSNGDKRGAMNLSIVLRLFAIAVAITVAISFFLSELATAQPDSRYGGPRVRQRVLWSWSWWHPHYRHPYRSHIKRHKPGFIRTERQKGIATQRDYDYDEDVKRSKVPGVPASVDCGEVRDSINKLDRTHLARALAKSNARQRDIIRRCLSEGAPSENK